MNPLASVSAVGNGVGPGLGYVITGDRHGVEVADVVGDKILLDIAHHSQAKIRREETGILPLILFQDICLYGATHILQCVGSQRGQLGSFGLTTVLFSKSIDLRVDRRVQKKCQHGRCRSVYRHGNGCLWTAEIESCVKRFHVIQRRD
ncbi:MAG: hypothetical protein Ct9H300mP16_07020 [Pseudomonadota bacterium]|nr:MAG: hypothetical protein Ct9H300mP16_07020 [Pseudomonadota bacterium]